MREKYYQVLAPVIRKFVLLAPDSTSTLYQFVEKDPKNHVSPLLVLTDASIVVVLVLVQ